MIMAEQRGVARIAESLHLYLQGGGRERQWEWLESFETFQLAPSSMFSLRPHLILLPKMVPPTGDQIFKNRNMWAIVIQTSIVCYIFF